MGSLLDMTTVRYGAVRAERSGAALTSAVRTIVMQALAADYFDPMAVSVLARRCNFPDAAETLCGIVRRDKHGNPLHILLDRQSSPGLRAFRLGLHWNAIATEGAAPTCPAIETLRKLACGKDKVRAKRAALALAANLTPCRPWREAHEEERAAYLLARVCAFVREGTAL